MTEEKKGPSEFDLVLAQILALYDQEDKPSGRPTLPDKDAFLRILGDLDTPQAHLLQQQVQRQAQLDEAIRRLTDQREMLLKLLSDLPKEPEI